MGGVCPDRRPSIVVGTGGSGIDHDACAANEQNRGMIYTLDHVV